VVERLTVGVDLIERLQALRQRGEPVALATVVASRRPASARPGDRALVLASGDLLGWIGGDCAQPTVQREALRALADGQPRLIRLSPAAAPLVRQEGVVEAAMTCHSGGTLEIYVEPFLPAPWLLVTGDTPVAEALASLAGLADFRLRRDLPDEAAGLPAGERYVVVAGMSSADEADLERALKLAPTYLAFVGSRRRLAEVTVRLRGRGLPVEQLGRIKGPAGLDIGAQTAAEIAISIMAEVVQHRRRARADLARPETETGAAGAVEPSGAGAEPAAAPSLASVPVAIDPVCGMEVAIQGARQVLEYDGERRFFCCPACRQRFAAEPARYLAGVAEAAPRPTPPGPTAGPPGGRTRQRRG
jgi:xanthine dehydrogenase accessory factor